MQVSNTSQYQKTWQRIQVHCQHARGSPPKKTHKKTHTPPRDIRLQPAMTRASQKLSTQQGDNISSDLPMTVRTAWTWTRKNRPEPGKVKICHARIGHRPTYTCQPNTTLHLKSLHYLFLPSSNTRSKQCALKTLSSQSSTAELSHKQTCASQPKSITFIIICSCYFCITNLKLCISAKKVSLSSLCAVVPFALQI